MSLPPDPLKERRPNRADGPRRLKICVVGSTYPRHAGDHEVPWLRRSVNLLAARGHRVMVLAPAWKGLRSHTIDGVRVRRFRYAPARVECLTHDQGAPNKLHNPIYNLLALPYILAGIVSLAYWTARERFDVIHVHWPFPHGLFAIIPQHVFGAKIVATCHGAELALGRKKPWIRKVLGWVLRNAEACSCNSLHTAAEIEAISGRRATVIPYGATVPVKAFEHQTAIRGKNPKAPATILFTGRAIQRKGVPYLLRALPQVLAERPVRLLITGNGDRREEWESVCHGLGLERHVEFLGFVSSERLGELYRACDLYVLPAIFDDKGDTEGLGVVLVEALMHAKPVIASAVGGIVDVIKDGQTGLLVPEKDPTALAHAILRVLSQPDFARRLGRAGREFASQHFNWTRITDETEHLYCDAVTPKETSAATLLRPQVASQPA
jgi:glycosyltransferase involved in cell wall biosynthesis